LSSARSLEAEQGLLLAAASEAAELALGYFHNGARAWTKGINSPVTEADIAVDRLLRKRLLGDRPEYGFLSEESDDDGSRLSSQRSFIVDPVDGTRAFIAHDTDWTILIALVEEGRPIASAIVAPARGETFRAVKGGGAFRNDRPIEVSTSETLDGAKLAASKRLLQSGVAGAPIAAQSVYFASLGYRLACVADGRLDGAAIRPNAQDWDLAAVDLLVHEAGGALSNLDGSSARYDRSVTGHGAMVAGSPVICSSLQRLVKSYLERGT